ncbi:MAG: SRPBCC domain-containing protein [Myxococcales bacterium]|nr:SRPBCC domain-containing protein [Myxococcales bacterium]
MSAVVSPRMIVKETVVPAPRAAVWEAWTTREGIRTFLAPEARVELRFRGPFEIHFDRDAPAGSQGSEGMTILSYLPEEMLSFTWNNPPELAEIRHETTFVVVQFMAVSPGETRVKLTHLGWPEGAIWDRSFAYFDRAWGVVMDRLRRRFIDGPFGWRANG